MIFLDVVAVAGVTDTVTSGPFVLAAALAVAAGAVSFASPCVIPLVPGYLSYIVGLVGSDSTQDGSVQVRVRRRAVIGTVLFVGGFTAVFVAETVLVLGLARGLLENQNVLMRIGGGVTILMGLAMAGAIPLLRREIRWRIRPRGRVFGAPLLGAAFGTGWVACIGPTLAGVISLSYATDWGGSAWRGLLLVLFYCAGLGIPFIVVAAGFGWATSALGFLRRHTRTIQLVGAAGMVLVGLLMVTGVWGQFIAFLRVTVPTSGTVL